MKGSYNLLIIEDDEAIRRPLQKYLEIHQFRVFEAGDCQTARDVLRRHHIDVVVSDWKLPDGLGSDLLAEVMTRDPNSVFILMTGYADINVAVESLRGGAFHYITKPISFNKLLEIIKAGIIEKLFYKDLFREYSESGELPEESAILGSSSPIQNVKNLIHLVKNLTTTVLINGETGTGKELVARAIHYGGKRKDKPYLCINCAAIPGDLLEDELFGHVKGAYTGAAQSRQGYFEKADGGSLFLDEIGNMSTSVQQKLLRVLQDRKITPLGTTNTLEVDVRIVAATNADLVKMVQEGAFREDLYYRLNVFPIQLPPLRERKDDIPILAQHFIAEFAKREGIPVKRICDACLQKLMQYPWYGNVRELRNAVEYAMIVSGHEKSIEFHHFNFPECRRPEPYPENSESFSVPVVPEVDEGVDFSAVVQEVEKKLLLDGLKMAGGNKQKAAQLLRMKRTTLVEKLKRLNLESPEKP